MYIFYYYPKCSTCIKAKKLLESRGAEFNEIDISKEAPSKERLKEILNRQSIDIKKLFNTSGLKYKEMGLKDKIKT